MYTIRCNSAQPHSVDSQYQTMELCVYPSLFYHIYRIIVPNPATILLSHSISHTRKLAQTAIIFHRKFTLFIQSESCYAQQTGIFVTFRAIHRYQIVREVDLCTVHDFIDTKNIHLCRYWWLTGPYCKNINIFQRRRAECFCLKQK